MTTAEGRAMPNDHRHLLETLVHELETGELPWYGRMAATNWWAWHILSGVALVFTLGSAVAVQLISDEDFKTHGRLVLTVIPLISALATGFLTLFKVREKEALRENGRLELEDIILNAKSLLAEDGNGPTPNYKKAFHQIRARAGALARAQHHGDFALRTDHALADATRVAHLPRQHEGHPRVE
jgi:hypothetical protein